MEVIQSDERLKQLYDAGRGFIYNDFEQGSRTKSSQDSNKLHRASCSECNPRRDKSAMTVNTSGQKIFFESFSEAIGWLMESRPGNYSKCGFCNPC